MNTTNHSQALLGERGKRWSGKGGGFSLQERGFAPIGWLNNQNSPKIPNNVQQWRILDGNG